MATMQAHHRSSVPGSRRVLIALALFTAFSALDVISTAIGVLACGWPDLNPLVDHLGFAGAIAYKLVVVGLMAAFAWLGARTYPRATTAVIAVAALATGLAVLSNVLQLIG